MNLAWARWNGCIGDVMKRNKCTWKWKLKPTNTQQPGNPGRRFGYRVVPGGERVEGDFFTPMSNRRKKKRARQSAWYNDSVRAMRKHVQDHEKKTPPVMPVKGPNGRWRPVVTKLSGASLEKISGGCVRAQIPHPDDTPQDTSYGRDLDFESVAQMNNRVASYAKD